MSCDFSAISEDSRTGVREHLRRDLPELDPKAAMFSAAHTHAAPSTCVRPRYTQDAAVDDEPCGFDLGVMEPSEYVASASERISKAVLEAWNAREAAAAQEKYRQEYEALVDGLEENPEKREGKRLYIVSVR